MTKPPSGLAAAVLIARCEWEVGVAGHAATLFGGQHAVQESRRWLNEAGVPKAIPSMACAKRWASSSPSMVPPTRELMDVLGHDAVEHAELYSREAEHKKLAEAAMRKLATRRRKPGPG